MSNWEHLKPYGYAPGNYMNRCHQCGATHIDMDKRAVTCRSCAEQMHAARASLAAAEGPGDAPDPEPVEPQAAEIVRLKQQAPAEPVLTLKRLRELSLKPTSPNGQLVRKRSGAQWQGRIVGRYSTALTPDGYAVESETHAGSVQIYPAAALEVVA